MKNRITVSIVGRDYTIVAEEAESYIRKVAAHVDQKMDEIMKESHASLVDAAVLAAMNTSDEYYKAMEAAENLRNQLKDYLDEATRAKQELSEARREVFRLQQEKQEKK